MLSGVYDCSSRIGRMSIFILFFSSSLSSGINAMAANTIEDVLGNYLKNTSQWAQTLVAKLIGKNIYNN